MNRAQLIFDVFKIITKEYILYTLAARKQAQYRHFTGYDLKKFHLLFKWPLPKVLKSNLPA